MEIQGLPGAWVGQPAFDSAVDAAASSSAQLCWTRQGILHIHDKQTGWSVTYTVPTGDARFAFDGRGRLAAAWFLQTGEVYTGAAGWHAMHVVPEGGAPLDLAVGNAGTLALLWRSTDGLYRTRIDAVSGRAISQTRLDDAGGPALLAADGSPVFAATSGLAGVESIQRVEQNWLALSTAHSLWMWQPGMRPQGVPAASAALELQLWAANGSTDVGATLAFPAPAGLTGTPVGSTTKAEYELANEGSSDIVLTTLRLGTVQPFRLDGAPNPPWRIAAGMLQGFFIDFSPVSAGAAEPSPLTISYCHYKDFDASINTCPDAAIVTRTVTITGTGTPAPAGPWLTGLNPETNMAGAPAFTLLVNGGGFVAGSTVLWNGTPLATTFISANQLSAAVPASAVAVPATANVTVSNPPGGTANVTKTWTFRVYSTVTPAVSLYDQNDVPLTAAQLTSNMTVRARVKLDQTASAALAGALTLTFQPAPASVTSDPSIALGSPTSTQQVGGVQTFSVPAGATTALFGTADYVTLTTGTTAGTVTLTPSLQYALPASPQSWTIAAAAPVIVSSSKAFTTDRAVITLQGYDNARSISSIAFTFRTASGAVVSPGTMTVDVTKDFANYFQANAQVGGSFVLTATFPVTGDISQISSATAVVTNGAGSATAQQ